MFTPPPYSDDVCHFVAGRSFGLIGLAVGFVLGAPSALAIPSEEYDVYGGLPRPWQAGVEAVEGITYNLANANVTTTVPIVSWSGEGPPLSFALYHNAHAAVSGLNRAWRLIYNSAWQLLETRSVSGGSQTTDKQFVQAGSGVQSEPRPSGSGLSSNLWSGGAPYIDDHVAMLTNASGSWTTHYYHADAQFNTLAMTGSSATVIERALYEPYGTASLTDSGGSPISTSAIGNLLLRQGIARDWETGNDENRHRWYAPKLGRWGQRDPLFSLLTQAPRLLSIRSLNMTTIRATNQVFGTHPKLCHDAVDPRVTVDPPHPPIPSSGGRVHRRNSGTSNGSSSLHGQYNQNGTQLYFMLNGRPTASFDPSGLSADCKCPTTGASQVIENNCNGVAHGFCAQNSCRVRRADSNAVEERSCVVCDDGLEPPCGGGILGAAVFAYFAAFATRFIKPHWDSRRRLNGPAVQVASPRRVQTEDDTRAVPWVTDDDTGGPHPRLTL